MLKRISLFIFLSVISFIPLSSVAGLTIEISGGGAQQIPIAIVPFKQDSNQTNIAAIIGDDLKRSGLFRVLETGEFLTVVRC